MKIIEKNIDDRLTAISGATKEEKDGVTAKLILSQKLKACQDLEKSKT